MLEGAITPTYDIMIALALISLGIAVGLLVGMYVGVRHIDVRVHRHPRTPLRWVHRKRPAS